VANKCSKKGSELIGPTTTSGTGWCVRCRRRASDASAPCSDPTRNGDDAGESFHNIRTSSCGTGRDRGHPLRHRPGRQRSHRAHRSGGSSTRSARILYQIDPRKRLSLSSGGGAAEDEVMLLETAAWFADVVDAPTVIRSDCSNSVGGVHGDHAEFPFVFEMRGQERRSDEGRVRPRQTIRESSCR
jgi:hypothetical protein